MKKYEYALIDYDDSHLIEALDHCNKMGKEGWELVSHSVYCNPGMTDGFVNVYHYFYFKREII